MANAVADQPTPINNLLNRVRAGIEEHPAVIKTYFFHEREKGMTTLVVEYHINAIMSFYPVGLDMQAVAKGLCGDNTPFVKAIATYWKTLISVDGKGETLVRLWWREREAGVG